MRGPEVTQQVYCREREPYSSSPSAKILPMKRLLPMDSFSII